MANDPFATPSPVTAPTTQGLPAQYPVDPFQQKGGFNLQSFLELLIKLGQQPGNPLTDPFQGGFQGQTPNPFGATAPTAPLGGRPQDPFGAPGGFQQNPFGAVAPPDQNPFGGRTTDPFQGGFRPPVPPDPFSGGFQQNPFANGFVPPPPTGSTVRPFKWRPDDEDPWVYKPPPRR